MHRYLAWIPHVQPSTHKHAGHERTPWHAVALGAPERPPSLARLPKPPPKVNALRQRGYFELGTPKTMKISRSDGQCSEKMSL